MAASAQPSNPSSQHVQALVPKFTNQDPDIRFMALNDLHSMLQNGNQNFLSHDYTTCARVVEGFLHTLNDQNGDVQNMAIKCLGPFVNKASDTILCPMIEKISNLQTDNTVDNSLPALAVRAIVVALPRPNVGSAKSPKVVEAYNAVSKAVIPRLVGHVIIPISHTAPAPPRGMLEIEIETGQDTNSLDILIEVASCFGTMLQEVEVQALKTIVMQVINSSKCSSVMKKKAVSAISTLSTYFTDTLLKNFVTDTRKIIENPSTPPLQTKLYISIYGAISRISPRKFGPHLKQITPLVLTPISQANLDAQTEADSDHEDGRDPQVEDVRESALAALDSFCAFCTSFMVSSAQETLDSALRFLRYDPNYAGGDEDMDADDGDADLEMDEDDDFEEETGFDDEDDVSWKVRRGSAKLVNTLVNARSLVSEEVLFNRIAPVLISRLAGEREETVRLEVIATLSSLLSKVRDPLPSLMASTHDSPQDTTRASRKRRRGSSSAGYSSTHIPVSIANGYASPSTPPPETLPQQSLASLSPQIIRAAAKLVKSSSTPTKQASLSLLTTLTIAQRGGLSRDIDLIIDPVIDILATGSSFVGGSNTALPYMRIEVLRFLRAVADLHSSKVLQSFVGRVIPVLTGAVNDKFAKSAIEAIRTLDTYIRALTPPRSAAASAKTAGYLKQINTVISIKVKAGDTDTEVRQGAVGTLGLLIGRTSHAKGSALLSSAERYAAQGLLYDRLRNELTRLASVRAVEIVASLGQTKDDFAPKWVCQVSQELAAQLRKADRSLRGASLSALRTLALNVNSRRSYDHETVVDLTQSLLPLLMEADLHMLGPALSTLSALTKQDSAAVASTGVTAAICSATKLQLQGSSLDYLLELVQSLGECGQGATLMQSLLKEVGVTGNAEVTGQVIGTLLVAAGGQDVGVTLDQFQEELRSNPDDERKCLALYILGEVGLRNGAESGLGPADFSKYFDAASDKVRVAAAVALGRAGAGDVKSYLPVIMDALRTGKQYLLLHAVKELLQHNTAEVDTLEFSKDLWDIVLVASTDSDNRALGAECIGRLATIDPAVYLPKLQAHLSASKQLVRGMIISAFRFTFTDTDPSYDAHLQPLIRQSLMTMLNEEDLENRRLGLTTFNSAAHNKPNLLLPCLSDLVPLIMKETFVREDLIREVSMGPFKHKVDDGLELRKAAYETLYALVDTALTTLNTTDFFDRIIAGIKDEHEIKIICCLILAKMVVLAPTDTVRRVDELAEAFRGVLAFRPKDNAVKQELEKLQEHNKAILKVMVQMNKAVSNEISASRPWQETFEWAKKEHPQAYKVAEEELKGDGGLSNGA